METHESSYHSGIEASERMGAGTSYLEGLTGIGAIAIAVVGLAHVYPQILVAVATIAVGASLLFEGGAIAGRFAALVSDEEAASGVVTRWGGLTTGFMAGLVGIALGILALVNIAPSVLTSIAAIVYGSALVFDSGVYVRLNNLERERYHLRGLSREVAYESEATVTGVQILVGLGAITLGILALVGINTLVLTLVAMLSLGTSLLLSGTLTQGRIRRAFRTE